MTMNLSLENLEKATLHRWGYCGVKVSYVGRWSLEGKILWTWWDAFISTFRQASRERVSPSM
jgi:hypothetical protein